MTFGEKAAIMADFVEASTNTFSVAQENPLIADALKEFKEVYRERRVHGFTEARREAYIAAFMKLL